jgi:type I restriction enzyme S subunit
MNYTTRRSLDELWLTDIPEHWDSRKIKYTFSERVEKGYPNEPLLVASQNMGVVPKGVYGNRTVEATKDLHNLKLVRIGDFVISLRSFQGGLEYAYYQGIISPAYTVMIPNEHITSGYFRFLAKSKLFVELLTMCVTGIREGQNIDYGKLKNHLIPLPPRDEQDQIVRYLERCCRPYFPLRQKTMLRSYQKKAGFLIGQMNRCGRRTSIN